MTGDHGVEASAPGPESIAALVQRRLDELGFAEGAGTLSLREAYLRMQARQMATGAADVPTYEAFRRILKDGHSSFGDRVAGCLADMLRIDVGEVYSAARIAPPLERFVLPTRADRLNSRQRAVVLAMVDALLDASGSTTEMGRIPAPQAKWDDAPPVRPER